MVSHDLVLTLCHYVHDAVPMDLDVKMKAVMLGATFLIVSHCVYRLACLLFMYCKPIAENFAGQKFAKPNYVCITKVVILVEYYKWGNGHHIAYTVYSHNYRTATTTQRITG